MRERKNNNAAVTTLVIGQRSDTASARVASIIGTVEPSRNKTNLNHYLQIRSLFLEERYKINQQIYENKIEGIKNEQNI